MVNLKKTARDSFVTGVLGMHSSKYKPVTMDHAHQGHNPAGHGVALNIHAGLSFGVPDAPGASYLGGTTPDLRAFNVHGQPVGEMAGVFSWLLGAHDARVLQDGGAVGVYLDNKEKKYEGQPHYLQLSQEDISDPVCISSITTTISQQGSLTDFVWLGDHGASCGAQWYPSADVIDDQGSTSPCVWLGRKKHTPFLHNGMSYQITGFHATDGRQEWVRQNPRVMCDSPARFAMYTHTDITFGVPFFDPPLVFFAGGWPDSIQGIEDRTGRAPLSADWAYLDLEDRGFPALDWSLIPLTLDGRLERNAVHLMDLERRTLAKRGGVGEPSALAKRLQDAHAHFNASLTVTDHHDHDVRTVCASLNSVGPDIVSLREGLFCDMRNRRLYVVCPAAATRPGEEDCFDLDLKAIRTVGPDGLVRRAAESPYSHFRHWLNGTSSHAFR
ncbi:hypothetical protein F4780DRAFT_778578 [Xylariomycetidae sp. FL0641]|nr:hypothetical protein F4780DRAFT_778578 [Xylariomycetidae sp. FL0641]